MEPTANIQMAYLGLVEVVVVVEVVEIVEVVVVVEVVEVVGIPATLARQDSMVLVVQMLQMPSCLDQVLGCSGVFSYDKR